MGDIIESYGYEIGPHEIWDDAIGLYHGTGHGIGVRIHEKPFQTADLDIRFQAGNVLTVEPGIYDPSTGGVRFEDVAVITEDGYENLMTYPRNMPPTEHAPPPEFLSSLPHLIPRSRGVLSASQSVLRHRRPSQSRRLQCGRHDALNVDPWLPRFAAS